MQNVELVCRDGYCLSALYGTPIEKSAKTIVISPGTAIRKEFYLSFARYLLQNGYNVLLFDYRGVGGSLRGDLKKNNAYMHEWGELDMNAALDFLVHHKQQQDIIWIGHSIGAQLVGMLKEQCYVKKVIGINAALGYWKYFPFPQRYIIWCLWFIISPVLVKLYGFGPLKLVKWGENLPSGVFMEWRKWCTNKNYFGDFLREKYAMSRFYRFKVPFVFIYTSDDYIANDTTAAMMLQFFPNAPVSLVKLQVDNYSSFKAGHSAIFRKRFGNTLWPELLRQIESDKVA